MITDIAINKPEPFLPEQPLPQFNRSINVHRAIKGLEAGKPILITEFYSNVWRCLMSYIIILKKPYRTRRSKSSARIGRHIESYPILFI